MVAIAEKGRTLIKLFSLTIPMQINQIIIGDIVEVAVAYNDNL